GGRVRARVDQPAVGRQGQQRAVRLHVAGDVDRLAIAVVERDGGRAGLAQPWSPGAIAAAKSSNAATAARQADARAAGPSISSRRLCTTARQRTGVSAPAPAR